MATVPGNIHDYFLLWGENKVRKYRDDACALREIQMQFWYMVVCVQKKQKCLNVYMIDRK